MNGFVKIFVLDDHEGFLANLGEFLDLWGIKNYFQYTSYNKFMIEFREDVDIVILDHRLNENMTGLGLLDRIYAKNKNCFIIVLSAQESFDVVVSYMNKGVDRYILKGSDESYKQLRQFVLEGIEKMSAFRKLKTDAGKDTPGGRGDY